MLLGDDFGALIEVCVLLHLPLKSKFLVIKLPAQDSPHNQVFALVIQLLEVLVLAEVVAEASVHSVDAVALVLFKELVQGFPGEVPGHHEAGGVESLVFVL